MECHNLDSIKSENRCNFIKEKINNLYSSLDSKTNEYDMRSMCYIEQPHRTPIVTALGSMSWKYSSVTHKNSFHCCRFNGNSDKNIILNISIGLQSVQCALAKYSYYVFQSVSVCRKKKSQTFHRVVSLQICHSKKKKRKIERGILAALTNVMGNIVTLPSTFELGLFI